MNDDITVDHEPFCDECDARLAFEGGLSPRATLVCPDCAPGMAHGGEVIETDDETVFVAATDGEST